MPQLRTPLALAATAAVLAFSLIGCAPTATSTDPKTDESSETTETNEQDAALEKYLEAEREQIPAIIKANPGVYSDVSVDSDGPGSVVFLFTYEKEVPAKEGAAYFDENLDTLQSAVDSAVFPAMKQFGVEGDLSATYKYVNPDGSTIWEKKFTPAA